MLTDILMSDTSDRQRVSLLIFPCPVVAAVSSPSLRMEGVSDHRLRVPAHRWFASLARFVAISPSNGHTMLRDERCPVNLGRKNALGMRLFNGSVCKQTRVEVFERRYASIPRAYVPNPWQRLWRIFLDRKQPPPCIPLASREASCTVLLSTTSPPLRI